MDQDNNLMHSNEETSTSPESTNVFDFENLRNSLPTTNHQPGRVSLVSRSHYRESVTSDEFRESLIQGVLKLENKFRGKDKFTASGITLMQNFLRETAIAEKSVVYGCPTSHDTEENAVSNRGVPRPERDFEHRRSEYHRHVKLAREKDRLKKMGFTRKLLLDKESSKSPENPIVFNFKYARNCLPTENHQCVKVSHNSPDFVRSELRRLMRAKALIHFRRELSNSTGLKPLRISSHQQSACLGEPSTSRGTERSTVSSNRVPRPQGQQTMLDQKRSEFHERISLARADDRLQKLSLARKLPMLDLYKTKLLPNQQCKHEFYVSVMSDVLEEKKRLQTEIQECSKLIQMLDVKEIQLKK